MKGLVTKIPLVVLAMVLVMGFGFAASAALVVVPIISGSDDAEEHLDNGNMDVTSSDLELGNEDPPDPQVVGMRFQSVAINQYSSIAGASIQFTVDETGSAATNVRLYGELTPNAATYDSTAFNISSRTATSNSVVWSEIPAWNTVGEAGANQQTPNLASIVQEIVDQGGWVSGNAMAIMVFPEPRTNRAGERTAESYEGSSSQAAVLTIDVAPTLFWNGDNSDWEASPQHWLTDPANPLSISPTSPDATTGAVMDRGGFLTVNGDRSALRLKMTGPTMNVVLVSAGSTLDIVNSIDGPGSTNFIVLEGDGAQLNTGLGNSTIGVMTTDVLGDASITVNTPGNAEVGIFSDEGSATDLRTFHKNGPGTLTLGAQGGVEADFTTFVINQGTLAVRGEGNLGNSPEVQFKGSQLDLYGAEAFQPGLRLDQQAGDMSFAPSQGNLGIDPLAVARITETNLLPPWADNTTFVYTGQINAPGGPISFFENIDDKTRLWIDGVLILNNDSWDTETAATIDLTAGWHDFELRMSNGGGGAGNEEGPRGFGVAFSDTAASVDPALYSDAVNPDPNVASLFRVPGYAGIDLTAAGTKFVVDTDSGSTFHAITDGDVQVPLLELRKGILEVRVTSSTPTLGTVTFGQTVIPGGTTGEVGVDIQAPTNLGPLNANGSTATVVKRGPYDWTLDAGNSNLGGAILDAQEGRIISTDLAGLGNDVDGWAGLAAKPGGEFVLKSTGGDLSIEGTVSGGAVGALGAPAVAGNNQLQEIFYDVPRGFSGLLSQPLDSGQGLLARAPTNTKPLDQALYFWNNDDAFRHAADRPVAVETYDYAVAWKGWICVGGPNLPGGDVTFGTESDDGSMLYIDLNGDGDFNDSGEVIVDNNGDHGRQQRTGTVNLAPGAYQVFTAFYERAGGDNMDAVFGSGANLAWDDMKLINPSDAAQGGIWGTDYVLTPPGPELGLLTAGQAGGPAFDVILNNFNPEGVIGLNAVGGSRFVITNEVNAPTGGFSVIAGETEIQDDVTVDFLEIRSGATLSNPFGSLISVTGNMLLGGGSLDLTGLPVSFGPTSIVVVGDGQNLTIDPAFDGGTLQLFGSGQLNINGSNKDVTVREGLVLESGARLDMRWRTLDATTAAVSIGRDSTLIDEDPLSVDSLTLTGPVPAVPGISVQTALSVGGGADVDLSGIPLSVGSSAAVTVNGGASLTTDDSLAIASLEVANGTITVGGGAGAITLSGNPTLGNGATVNADLAGNVDLTIDVGEQGVVSLLGPGTVVYDDTRIVRGGLEVSPDAANLGSGVLRFDAVDNNHQAVLISRDSVPGVPGFTREMGTGDGQVYWDDDGGFAARGGQFTISLTVGGTPNGTIKADGGQSDGFDDERLMLGHAVADSLVTLTNPIEMNDNFRIEVGNNPNTDQDVGRLTGVIANPVGDTTARELMHDSNNEEGTLWLDPRDPVTGDPVANTWYGELEIDEGAVRALDGFGLSANANLRLDGDSNERVAGMFESWDESDWEAAKAANEAVPGSVPMPGFRRSVGTGPGQVRFEGSRGGFTAWDNPDTPEVEVLHVTLNAVDAYDVKGPTLEWDNVFGPLDDNKFMTGSRTANSMVTYTNDINGHANGEDNEFHMFDNPHSDGDVTRLTGVLTLIGSFEMDDVGAAAGGVLWLDPRDASGNPTQNVFAAGGDGVDIEEGVLRAVDGFGLDVDSELNFSGGNWYEVRIFESYDTDPNDPTTGFRRQINPGSNDGVDWDTSAGFSAFDNPDTPEVEVLHVTLNPADAADTVGGVINWDDDLEDNVLQLNSPHANSVVIVTNPIDFADDDRNVIVWDNPLKQSDWAEIAGVMSGLAQDDFSKHGPGKLVLSADNTYGGATIVTEGTLVLTGTNSYMGGTFMAAGTVVAAQSGSLGSGPLVFNGGGLELMDSFGSASRAARIGDAGATVNTAAGTSLTLTYAGGGPSGSLTKLGDGSLTVANGFVLNGEINFLGGSLNLAPYILAQRGGAVTIGAGLTLPVAGSVNRQVLGGPSSVLKATGPLDIGLLDSPSGYNFQGHLEVGPHMVGLKDADKAQVYETHLGGGSLSSFNGIGLQAVDVFGTLGTHEGWLTGHGTVKGAVRFEVEGANFAAIAGDGPGQEIVLDGVVSGSGWLEWVIMTGLHRPGASAGFTGLGQGTNIGPGATVMGIDGTAGFATPNPAENAARGYDQWFAMFGQHAISGDLTMSLEAPTPGGEIHVPDPSVRYEVFKSYAPGGNPVNAGWYIGWFNNVTLDPGWPNPTEWVWEFDYQDGGLGHGTAPDPGRAFYSATLMVIPEPGSLVLLIGGGLCLLGWAWRRRRRR